MAHKSLYNFSFSFKELVGLYLLLHDKNLSADMTIENIKTKIRDILYDECTIDQMEKLEEYYKIL